ncbi:MAG: pilus (MSHA type) biogenesis protein MshL [Rhodocyclaceae bacterium]|nr:pilus (MSHA type) biogenesis protein MshL [Rhodocyclaceae bacterium]
MRSVVILLSFVVVASCSVLRPPPVSRDHLSLAEDVGQRIEAPLREPLLTTPVAPVMPTALPVDKKAETYTVIVNKVRIQDLLFALARDAKINVDIHPGIEGAVTLNAVDQTLPQLLSRLARQVELRWEMDGQNLAVMPDTPYLHLYKVDYVNMSRDTTGSVSVTTQIAVTGMGAATGGTGNAGNTGNNSLTRIDNRGQNRFWETLERNIKELLRETDKILPDGSSETVTERVPRPEGVQGVQGVQGAQGVPLEVPTLVRKATFREAAAVIVNPESGLVSVRATFRQHEKIREFLLAVMSSARRQVLIEATVAEVTLNERYQQGIDWSRMRSNATASGLDVVQSGAAVTGAGLLTLTARRVAGSSVFAASLRLLETFGTVRVLSSPKLSVINNQTAVLKVVDNLVYFTIKADTVANQTVTTTTYTTNLHSVPVGLVMNVTPQISEDDIVLINVRPSISRKYAEVDDPNPDLKKNNITSKIPVIRTREMETMIRIMSGQVAVMGGLMEDATEDADSVVPGLSSLPIIGELFKSRDDSWRKTELVIFLRPTVVR